MRSEGNIAIDRFKLKYRTEGSGPNVLGMVCYFIKKCKSITHSMHLSQVSSNQSSALKPLSIKKLKVFYSRRCLKNHVDNESVKNEIMIIGQILFRTMDNDIVFKKTPLAITR